MGNKLPFNKNKDADSIIGQDTKCPNCSIKFGSKTSYYQLNSHIDQCLKNQHPPVQVVNELPPPNMFQTNKPKYQSIGENYYWIKVPRGDQSVWERKQITNINEASIAQQPSNVVKNLTFPEKQFWVKVQLDKIRIPWQMGADWIKIQQDDIIASSIESMKKCNMHKEVKISFLGDKVQDAGGLLREWILLLFKELTNPCLGVFMLAETEDVCYRINPDVEVLNPYLENCLKLCGKAIGKAVFERLPLNIFFDRPFIKRLIGQEVTLEDIKYFDKYLFESWSYLLKNDINPDDLQQNFVIQRGNDIIELMSNGLETLIDNENKQQFVQLSIQHHTELFINKPLKIIFDEIYNIVPKECWSVFDFEEAELVLYGVPYIDLDEWKEQTLYDKPYTQEHKNIQWFWQILAEFDQEQIAKFLQFCTGSTRIPVNGFSKLESNRGNFAKFKIVQIPYLNQLSFPKAHTCFNRLELPQYPNLEIQRLCLKAVVTNDLEGIFGME